LATLVPPAPPDRAAIPRVWGVVPHVTKTKVTLMGDTLYTFAGRMFPPRQGARMLSNTVETTA